jgi:hypothetical protein
MSAPALLCPLIRNEAVAEDRPVMIIPDGFSWTEEETVKLGKLARQLNCTSATAGAVLAYFLRYIVENRRGLPVAMIPEVLVGFPIRWGYKKKRNDFLKLLHDLEFIRVEVNYWAKVRAKRYGPGLAGHKLLERLQLHARPDHGSVFPVNGASSA